MQALGENRIAELRDEQGLVRSEVAGHLKIDQSTLWRWENGGAIPDQRKVDLAELFGVSVGYLMGWSAERAAA